MSSRYLPLRILGVSVVLALVLVVVALLALASGPVPVSWAAIWEMMRRRMESTPISTPLETIIFELRLPRIILAAGVGAALSMSGAGFQGLLRNPLADPYIVGVSAGSALGAAIGIMLHLEGSWLGISIIPLLAFIGAVLAMLAVYFLSVVDNRIPVETFLLAGVVVGSFLWALVSFLLTLASQDLPRVVFWLMGSLSERQWPQVGMLLPYLLLGGAILYFLSHPLNLMSMGEESAGHMGVEVEKTKIWVILAASLLAAAAVSVSGLIGFVGLMIPHIARRVVGPDHRILLPAAALAGAAFLVGADTLARVMMAPRELPVGIITALLGAPFFCYLLRQVKRRK